MSTALKIGKGLLKVTWFLFKISIVIIGVALDSPKKRSSRYSIYEADELFDKGQISIEEYNDVFKAK